MPAAAARSPTRSQKRWNSRLFSSLSRSYSCIDSTTATLRCWRRMTTGSCAASSITLAKDLRASLAALVFIGGLCV
jgi:flagellar biosynthesis regulator FlaF